MQLTFALLLLGNLITSASAAGAVVQPLLCEYLFSQSRCRKPIYRAATLAVLCGFAKDSLVGKIFLCPAQYFKETAFENTLGALKYGYLVEFASRPDRALNLSNQRNLTNNAIKRRVFGAKIGWKPFVNSINPVPFQAIEIIDNRIEAVL